MEKFYVLHLQQLICDWIGAYRYSRRRRRGTM